MGNKSNSKMSTYSLFYSQLKDAKGLQTRKVLEDFVNTQVYGKNSLQQKSREEQSELVQDLMQKI